MSNFQPLEVVGRGSETQLQVAENVYYLISQDESLSVAETASTCSTCLMEGIILRHNEHDQVLGVKNQ